MGDDSVDGEAVLGRGFDDGHVAKAEERHVEGAGDGRSAHGEHVDVLLDLLDALLVADAEALLLVDDEEAEVAELDVFGEDAVGAGDDIDGSVGDARKHGLGVFGSDETAEHFDASGEGSETAFEGFVVLEAENGGGSEDGDLFSVAESFEGGAHRDFGFAEADIAAEQAVHGVLAFHVALDVARGVELVLGFGVFEGVLELALPAAVAGELESAGHAALGVEFEQLVGHVAHFGLDARFGALPTDASEFVERGGGVAGAAEFLDEVHASQGDVELGVARVFDQHEIAALAVLGKFADAEETADAVDVVYDVIAHGEVGGAGGESGEVLALRSGAFEGRDGFEQIIGADDGDGAVRENDAAANAAFDQKGAGVAAAEIAALGEVGRGGVGGLHGELERDGVLAEDVSEAFDFTESGREEGDAVAAFDEAAAFLDGERDVALKTHGGASGDVERFLGGFGGEDFDLAQFHFGFAFDVGAELAPTEEDGFGGDERRSGFGVVETLPETFGGGGGLFGLVDDDYGIGDEREQGVRARMDEGDEKLPAGEGFAGRRKPGLAVEFFAQLAEEGGGFGELEQREDGDFGDAKDGALGFDVEAADGFDLVTEEFDPDGLGGFGGVDIEDAAADGELAGHFDGFAAFVADGEEMCGDVVERDFPFDAEGESELAIGSRGGGAKEGGGDGSDGDAGAAIGETPESGGALGGYFTMRAEALGGKNVEGGD